jgi:aminotransferase EvaB
LSKDNSKPVVPFNDLGRGTTLIRESIDEAISRVVSSGWYVLGPEHDAFEKELAAYVGVAHAIGVGNGTDALQLALTGLGVGPGDAVLTAANAGGYTSTAARSIGAVPVFADVDAASMLLTVETIAEAVAALDTPPKVIVVTHLFGTAADIASIVEWSHSRGIAVLEDCAQSLGAMAGDVRAGSVADVSTTSFYPTKNLGALGDGGAILTSDDDLARTLRQLRQYGWSSKYQTTVQGGRNSRLDELQAAVLRAKLTMLDGWNTRRREIHSRYEAAVSDGARMVNTSTPAYVGHLAVVEVADRDLAKRVFEEHGIRTDVHYPIPDHLQPIAAGAALASALTVTERAAQHIISVPLFPELTDDEIERTCVALSEL